MVFMFTYKTTWTTFWTMAFLCVPYDWLLLSFPRWMIILNRLSDISTKPFRQWTDVSYCFPVSAPKLSSTVHQDVSKQMVSCFLITCLLDNESIMQNETRCSSQLAFSVDWVGHGARVEALGVLRLSVNLWEFFEVFNGRFISKT